MQTYRFDFKILSKRVNINKSKRLKKVFSNKRTIVKVGWKVGFVMQSSKEPLANAVR